MINNTISFKSANTTPVKSVGFVKKEGESFDFDAKNLRPLDVVNVEDYGDAMQGVYDPTYRGIVLTEPNKKGDLNVLVMDYDSPEIRTININTRNADSIQKHYGRLDIKA
jgi:hypothetical protein